MGAVYVHWENRSSLSPAFRGRMMGALTIALKKGVVLSRGMRGWNVLKIETGRAARNVSFLWYPSFHSRAHPMLERSVTVNLKTGDVADRRYDRHNPPILHRKELLLAADDPLRRRGEALTEAEIEAGLLRGPRRRTSPPGRRQAWEALLREKGYSIRGHTLVKVDS